MKLFIVHRKNVYTNYKQSLCSFAAVFVIIVTVFSVIVPFYITFSLYHDTWPQQKIIYEQPDIQFKYNYIFLAEHINIQVSNENLMENVIPIVSTKSLACNSYKYLIDTLDVNPECSIVKFWEKDYDFNGKTDQINFQIIFRPPAGYALDYFNLFLEIDTQLSNRCELKIPAAILIQQEQITDNFYSGEITIEGHVKMIQKQGFHCPFFLHHKKTHFFHTLIPENSTDIEDYDLSNIQKRLSSNPAYISYEKMSKSWNRRQNDLIILNIILNIEEISTRYHKTFWQRLGFIWIEYLSILIIFCYAIDIMKTHIFTEQIIKAWEIIPWKKLY